MSQQINLINTALIKQKDFLTPATISLVYLCSALLMLGWYWISQQALHQAIQQRDVANAELTKVQASVTQATAMRAPRAPSQALLRQLEKLKGQQQMQAHILNMVNKTKANTASGLANTMRGFARQTVDGLWLTGFSLDTEHQAMTIRGRSTHENLLPLYMQQLGQETVFSGQHFGGLQMKRVTPSAVPSPAINASSNTATSEPVAPPQYIEFELQAIKTTNPSEVASAAEAKPAEVKS